MKSFLTTFVPPEWSSDSSSNAPQCSLSKPRTICAYDGRVWGLVAPNHVPPAPMSYTSLATIKLQLRPGRLSSLHRSVSSMSGALFCTKKALRVCQRLHTTLSTCVKSPQISHHRSYQWSTRPAPERNLTHLFHPPRPPIPQLSTKTGSSAYNIDQIRRPLNLPRWRALSHMLKKRRWSSPFDAESSAEDVNFRCKEG